MKRKIAAIVIAVLIIASNAIPTFAGSSISEAQVVQKLASAESKWPNGSVYVDQLADGCGTCFGFLRELFIYVFNAGPPTQWSLSQARFTSSTNVTEIGHLSANYSVNELSALLRNAKPGDVLLASNGSTVHGVIIRSVTQDGTAIYVYDANWFKNSSGQPLIYTNRYWTADNIHSKKPTAVTLYRYANYDTTPGSGPSTLSINPEDPPTGNLPVGQSYPLKGTVTSNYLITRFDGSIVTPSGEKKFDVSTAPNAYSVNIRSSAVNNDIIFNQLPAGCYQLRYYAADSSGQTKNWSGDWFWIGPTGEHTHDKGSFEFYEAAHPHCNCYKCSYCGEIWRDTSSSNEMDSCYYCQKPGKPALKNFSTSYGSGSTITFNWDSVEKATHYNLYIDKQNADGSWDQFLRL